jgi:dTDP-4-amino-4,6-dideoxygalactose transaminase
MNQDAWKRFSDSGFKHYEIVACGFKYNMTDIQAAIGIHQLKRIEENWLRRQAIWTAYNEAFDGLRIQIPAPPEPHTRHGYHLYTVLIDARRGGLERDQFVNEMVTRRIGVGVHYLSAPEHPYYQEAFGWKPDKFPCATRIGRQTVSLPVSPKLTRSDVERVIAAVRAILE